MAIRDGNRNDSCIVPCAPWSSVANTYSTSPFYFTGRPGCNIEFNNDNITSAAASTPAVAAAATPADVRMAACEDLVNACMRSDARAFGRKPFAVMYGSSQKITDRV